MSEPWPEEIKKLINEARAEFLVQLYDDYPEFGSAVVLHHSFSTKDNQFLTQVQLSVDSENHNSDESMKALIEKFKDHPDAFKDAIKSMYNSGLEFAHTALFERMLTHSSKNNRTTKWADLTVVAEKSMPPNTILVDEATFQDTFLQEENNEENVGN